MDEEIKKILSAIHEAIQDGRPGHAQQHRETLDLLLKHKTAATPGNDHTTSDYATALKVLDEYSKECALAVMKESMDDFVAHCEQRLNAAKKETLESRHRA